MKIAICDDERMYRYEIGRIIEQYMEEKGIVFQIKLFESGIEMLEDEEDISSYSNNTLYEYSQLDQVILY